MNELGVPSHLFRGPPAAVAAALRRHGLTRVQLTPDFPGLRFREPGQLTPERCRLCAEPFRAAGVQVACLSGPGPLLDPDLERRHRTLLRLHALVRHAPDFGTDRVVVEAGSLGPHSPWAPFPPNHSAAARAELVLVLREALRRAADHGVTLLLKPEPAQVLASAEDAARLREELPDPRLRFVMDPAHLLLEAEPGELNDRLEPLFAQLGPWSPVAHLKDVSLRREGPRLPRAGQGGLDLARFARLLRRYQPDAPVILEHLRPDEVGETVAHVARFMKEDHENTIHENTKKREM